MREEILNLLEENGEKLSTNQVAEGLDVSWWTAKNHLQELLIDGKVKRKKEPPKVLWYVP